MRRRNEREIIFLLIIPRDAAQPPPNAWNIVNEGRGRERRRLGARWGSTLRLMNADWKFLKSGWRTLALGRSLDYGGGPEMGFRRARATLQPAAMGLDAFSPLQDRIDPKCPKIGH